MKKTPLAIRRFARFMYLESNAETEYLFLIGKAISLPDPYFNQNTENFLNIRQSASDAEKDLVPSIGYPPSDVAFTSGLREYNTQTSNIDIPIGRIPAISPEQIGHYLNKVIEHEQNEPGLWQKRGIHLSGGNSVSEQALFKTYLNDFQAIIENSFWGAQIEHISKPTTTAIYELNLSAQVNEGVGFISYFVHSSLDLMGLDIGRVSNDELGYRNKGRYPLMVLGGSQLGAVFYENNGETFAEDWLFTKDRGAIAVIAHSSLGYLEPLRTYMRSFYNVLREPTSSQKSLGNIIQKTIRNNQGSSIRSKSMNQQMILLGDPAISLIKANQVDYTFQENTFNILDDSGQMLNLESDFAEINFAINNLGTVDDAKQQFEVQLKHIYPNEYSESFTQVVSAISFQENLSWTIPVNKDQDLSGKHRFELTLDITNLVAESSELNNSLTTEIELNITNTESFKDFDIQTYPNPSSDYIQVINEQHRVLGWEILDLNGKPVSKGHLSGQNLNIDISKLTSGIYLLKFIDQYGRSAVQKIVID